MPIASGPIPALRPSGAGVQFVFYGDSCSGVPGAINARAHERVNAVVRRLTPPPEFIVYPGDEVIGLVADEAELRAQWRYWFETEMGWLDRAAIPMFNATANHTVYDDMSARVFQDVMAHHPRNGPPGQDRLAYAFRREDALFVVANTLDQTLGGEGHVETDWLAETLAAGRDARWRFVVGHHPAFPVNGYVGPYQRTIGDEYRDPFWRLLVENSVTAYLCSHILAFDVQCHAGVLQICSAGAGTAHRMPEGEEYLHAAQIAVDGDGLRCQVLDDAGVRREAFSWPPSPPGDAALLPADAPCPAPADMTRGALTFAVSGIAAPDDRNGKRQTLFCAADARTRAMPLWIGLAGRRQTLTVSLQPIPGRSPHQWLGPDLAPGAAFAIDVMLHPDLGPGGLLWRRSGDGAWTSLEGASAWGMERLEWPDRIQAGCAPAGAWPFRGRDLKVAWSRAG